jgi:hypothetical protein
MGIFRGVRTTQTQANLILDASSLRSYSGSGNVWYDISGSGHYADIIGSPTIETLGGAKCFHLDTVGKRFVARVTNFSTNNLTFEAWIFPQDEISSGDRGCIIQGSAYLSWNKGNQRLSSYWYSTNNQGYHEPSLQMNRDTWHHMVGVWNADDGRLYQYINGNLENTVTTVASSGAYYNDMNIGWEGDGRQFSGGIAVIKIYNAALSGAEVLQNYNAQKARFKR